MSPLDFIADPKTNCRLQPGRKCNEKRHHVTFVTLKWIGCNLQLVNVLYFCYTETKVNMRNEDHSTAQGHLKFMLLKYTCSDIWIINDIYFQRRNKDCGRTVQKTRKENV